MATITTPLTKPSPATSGTEAATPTRSLSSTYDPTQGAQLMNDLNSQYEGSQTNQGILSRYKDAQRTTGEQYQATGKYLQTQYGQDIDYQKEQNQYGITGVREAQRGFGTSPALLNNMQQQADQRVKKLTDQSNAALMANNTAAAAALSDLAVKEQDAITSARTNFLNQYFAAQGETRAEAQFQPTLENLMAQTGLSKAQAAAIPDQVRAALMSASAAQTGAGAAVIGAQAQSQLAGAQSAQTRMLTDYLSGSGAGGANQEQDVQSLIAGSITPQQLQEKYQNFPGGFGGAIANNIMAKAQAQGYSVNQGTLSGLAQEKRTAAQNSGNPVTMLTSWLSGFGQEGAAKVGNLGGGSVGSIRVKGPDGRTGTVPASQLQNAIKAGYVQVQ